MNVFSHINNDGHINMVDVTDKDSTQRIAVACGYIYMNKKTMNNILNNKVQKGNVFETARIAGIMAAKKTSELIPLCHPLNISHVKIDFTPNEAENYIKIEAIIKLISKTGVEMEALTAVSISALTIYDMCKSYDKTMTISNICLLKKEGGKSGTFERDIK